MTWSALSLLDLHLFDPFRVPQAKWSDHPLYTKVTQVLALRGAIVSSFAYPCYFQIRYLVKTSMQATVCYSLGRGERLVGLAFPDVSGLPPSALGPETPRLLTMAFSCRFLACRARGVPSEQGPLLSRLSVNKPDIVLSLTPAETQPRLCGTEHWSGVLRWLPG